MAKINLSAGIFLNHVFSPGNFIIFSEGRRRGKVGKSHNKLIMNHSDENWSKIFCQFSFANDFLTSKINFDPERIDWHKFPLDVFPRTLIFCKKSEQLQKYFLHF